MKTLITGSSGLLGTEIVKQYQEQKLGYHYLKNNKVYNSSGVEVDESKIVFEKIIHCAANSSQVYNEHYPSQIFEDNVVLVQKIILRFAKKQKPIFIFPSSIVVYGDSYYAAHEDRNIPAPTTLYGVSKLAAEHIVNYYTKIGLISGFNFRLSALCAIDAKKGALAHIISKLQNIELPKLELYGDYPGSVKPYTLASEVAKFFRLFSGNKQFQPLYPAYNLCVNDNISINEIADIAMRQLGIFKDIEWLGDKSLYQGDNKVLLADSYLAEQEFGWGRYSSFHTSEKVIKYVCDMSSTR